MLRAAAFGLGNLVAGWVLSSLLVEQLHYPADIPVRLHPQATALLMAALFSLAGILTARLKPRLRAMLLILSMPLSIAGAGALLFASDRGAGALIALSVAHHSPLALASGAGWGLVWSFLIYPPVLPTPEPQAKPVHEDLPVSDSWSGNER